jgi:hypothetical protein
MGSMMRCEDESEAENRQGRSTEADKAYRTQMAEITSGDTCLVAWWSC